MEQPLQALQSEVKRLQDAVRCYQEVVRFYELQVFGQDAEEKPKAMAASGGAR